MRQLITILRTHKYEIIASLINIVVAFVAFHFKDNLIVFVASVVIFTASLIFIIYQKIRDRDFYFLPLNKPDQVKDWVGRGDFAYMRSEECFEITQSHSGWIFPKTLTWDDYSFEFDFKIARSTCGFIVRAQDLSNYIMMQIATDGINPHIRLDSEWIPWQHNDPQANLTFEHKLSLDTWYKAKIYCDKRRIRMTIFDKKKKIFDRSWEIKERMLVVYPAPGDDRSKDTQVMRQVDFDFGAIGFRNHGDERAFVKNVYVEKL